MKIFFMFLGTAVFVLAGFVLTSSAATVIYDQFDDPATLGDGTNGTLWYVSVADGFNVPTMADSILNIDRVTAASCISSKTQYGPGTMVEFKMEPEVQTSGHAMGFSMPNSSATAMLRNDQGDGIWQLVVDNRVDDIFRSGDVFGGGGPKPGSLYAIAWYEDSTALFEDGTLLAQAPIAMTGSSEIFSYSSGHLGWDYVAVGDAPAVNPVPVRPPNPVLKRSSFEVLNRGEHTPFVFNGESYIALNSHSVDPTQQEATYLYINRFTDGQEVARFGTGFAFVSAFVNGNQLNVFGTKNTNDNWTEDVYRFWTTDMASWQQEKVISRIGDEHLFNTSVCRGRDGYVMAYESNLPVAWSFRLANSDDLSGWDEMGLQFADVKDGSVWANPTIRYCAPFYYLIYGTHCGKGPSLYYDYELETTKYVTLVARSRDLVTWEFSPTKSPMIEPSEGEGVNATDADIFEYEGKTYLTYMTGDQHAWRDIHAWMYDGPMQEMLEAYFPANVPTMKYDAKTGITSYYFSTPLPVLNGDANGDGVVNEADAAILAGNWLLQGGASWADGDFNGDGNVDDIDATLLAANWQVSLSSNTVPEPSVLTLFASMLLVMALR